MSLGWRCLLVSLPRSALPLAPNPAGTTTTLTRKRPLNPGNLVAMELSGTGSGTPAGIVNSGYWGGEAPVAGRPERGVQQQAA